MKNAPPDSKTIEDYFTLPDVHDVRREEAQGGMTFVMAAIACAVESLLIYGLLTERLSIMMGVLLHVVMIAILALYSRAMIKNGKESCFALLLLLTSALTGPLGAGGVMLCILMHWWFSRHSIPFWQWFQSIFPAQPQTGALRIYDNIMMGRDESAKSYSVISFLDVVSFGNEIQKRQALAKMASNFHPHFAPAFKKGLEDKSNMIRVQAATAITKVETLFLKQLMQLSKVQAEHPDDPVVILAMAKHYDNYAYTGLLDIDREQANRRKALEYYQTYLALRPQDAGVRNCIGRILMRDKDYEQACIWFRGCIEQGYNAQVISQWYSEALFACGRYDELRRYRATLPQAQGQEDAFQPELQAALKLWSGAAA